MLKFKKFYCSYCSNQSWIYCDTAEHFCPHCGNRTLYDTGKDFALPFVDTVETGAKVQEEPKKMNLNTFSDRLTRYEMELEECPFCRETRNLLIHQQTVAEEDRDEEDYDKDLLQYVIECEECGVIMKSMNYFPTMECDYEKLDQYVAELCQQ